jgi:hypothetical protein
MIKLSLITLGAIALATLAVAAFGLTRPDTSRADCPGKITCPLTGELVCVDRCPVEAQTAAVDEALPSCCKP